jgi:hypothetical protein
MEKLTIGLPIGIATVSKLSHDRIHLMIVDDKGIVRESMTHSNMVDVYESIDDHVLGNVFWN